MPKPISLKKHIHPGVIVKIGKLLYEVTGIDGNCFLCLDFEGDEMAWPFDEPNMTVYHRVSDNNLPF